MHVCVILDIMNLLWFVGRNIGWRSRAFLAAPAADAYYCAHKIGKRKEPLT